MLKDSYYTEPTELDCLVFEKLVPADHYLRKVKGLIDFARFREMTKDCYSPDMGRGAMDPVLLIKLEFLEFHYNLSDREVIAEAQVNVAFRFFLELSLTSSLPVPSLLAQFRTRIGDARHQAFLDEVIAQARAYGLVKDRLRRKDATHVIANIAVPAAIQLVAQIRDRLLKALRPYSPQRVAEETAHAAALRQATADLKDEERLLQRVAHLRQIVGWAAVLQAGLEPAGEDPDCPRQRLASALVLAHQVLADQEDPDKGDRLLSPVDPEARQGKHGDYYDGYKLDISMDGDSELLTALEVLPANGDEAANAAALLAREETAHGNDVVAISMDGAGFRGEVLRTLSAPTGLAVTVYVPVPKEPAVEGAFFPPEDFLLDPLGHVLTCPGGAGTSTRFRNRHDTGWVFQYRLRQCQGCSLLAHCMASLPRKHGRMVTKNDYVAEYNAARSLAKTPAYAAVRAVHPKVERKLAEIVRYHGGRRTRYRGRWRVRIQYLLTAIAVNIKRMVRLLAEAQRPAWMTIPVPHQAVLVRG
jgi:transposase